MCIICKTERDSSINAHMCQEIKGETQFRSPWWQILKFLMYPLFPCRVLIGRQLHWKHRYSDTGYGCLKRWFNCSITKFISILPLLSVAQMKTTNLLFSSSTTFLHQNALGLVVQQTCFSGG